MRVRNRMRLCILLLVGLSVVGLAYEGAKSADAKLEMTVQASHQTAPQATPIPAAGPLANPKSLKQVGVPLEATHAAVPSENPQTREKIALGEKLFFDGRLSVDGTVACSTCHDPARAFTA